MDKLDPILDGTSKNIIECNIEKLAKLFPDILVEGKIDFDTLRELMGTRVVDTKEHYSFAWLGKSLARRIAQTPSNGTLRPFQEESINWSKTNNLHIDGVNLDVLKLMQKIYHKKENMIYID